MAVKIEFDNLHNAIKPSFVLATRSGNKLGIIPADEIYFGENLSSGSNLTFKVYKEKNGKVCDLWDDIVDFKLVWSPEWDKWFEISVEISESNNTYKNISGISVGEGELSQVNLYEMEVNTEDDIAREDYSPTVLFNPSNEKASLLHRIISKVPHYNIGHVDDSIKDIQRTFQFNDISIYDALQEIAAEINCQFIIDSSSDYTGKIMRTINAYDLCSICLNCGERGQFTNVCPECGSTNISEGLGEDTNVFISVDNLADDISYSTNTDSVKNCFRLVAGDDLMTATIKSCNPNGSNYIWYITDESRNDMSLALRTRLSEYDALYQEYKNNNSFNLNSGLVSAYNALVTKYRTYEPSLEYITNPIVGHSALLNTYYNALDFDMFLDNKLMPSVSISSTSAEQEAAKLTSSALSPVAVTNLSSLSVSSASSAVLSMAKTIVDKRYQVKVKNSSLNNTTWTGSFTVTNYSDDEDTDDSSSIDVTITDSYEDFILQKIHKSLSEQSEDATDISALFSLNLSNFRDEIKKYCLKSLNSFNEACLACLNILIEQGVGNNESWAGQSVNLYETIYVPYYNKQIALMSEIQLRENELEVIRGTKDENGGIITDGIETLVNKQISAVQKALDFETYLGTSLMKELSAYRREQTYENANYISDGLDNATLIENANEFIKAAENELFRSASLQHTISANLKNLLIMKEFEPIINHFQVGNWIRIKVDDSVYKLRLIGYSISFDSLESLSVEFSDIQKIKDGISDIESIISKASSMSTSYETVSRQADKGASSKNSIDSWTSQGFSLTKMRIIDSASNQNLQIDDQGLLCREYLPDIGAYDSKQLKLINQGLYLTDDGWNTSRAGIGRFTYYDPEDGLEKEAYGVIADTIMSNVVLSQKVGVYNKTGSIKLDENGLTLISKANGVTDVFRIQKEDSNGTRTNVIYFDNAGNACFEGNISASSITAGTISADRIAAGSITESKIGSSAITASKISQNAVTADKISSNAITADKIAANAITADKIAANAVTADMITSGLLQSSDGKSSWDLDTGIFINSYTSALGTMEVQISDGKIEFFDNSVRRGVIDGNNGWFNIDGFPVVIGDVSGNTNRLTVDANGIKLFGDVIVDSAIGNNIGLNTTITIGGKSLIFASGILVDTY